MTDTTLPLRRLEGMDLTRMLDREWLVTNGLGGYASGTISGAATRRYHGLLVSAQPAPLGRLMMLNHLAEAFRFPDWSVARVGGVERVGGKLEIHGADHLALFELDAGLPVWRFTSKDHIIEKRLVMPYRQNTTYVLYRLVAGDGPVRLKLRPSVHFRHHDSHVSTPLQQPYKLTACGDRYEIHGESPDHPCLRFRLDGPDAALTLSGLCLTDVLYRIEEDRGYDGIGSLYSPGEFRVTLHAGAEVALTASTEPWSYLEAQQPAEAMLAERERRRRLISAAVPALREGFGAELVLAADQFVITPATRTDDTARANAIGDEARTVIAGYHWFTDWGRDTMISLEGLTLVTGRATDAGRILRTFASHVRNGLIPNYFHDEAARAVYHTADATLWYFHALSRYLASTNDGELLQDLLPILKQIVAQHVAGTDFGIGVDPADSLLKQGAPGYQLTWMDAKVGDWVVTPRRGKAVEINALWYNALKLLAGWLADAGDPQAADLEGLAESVRVSFNRRFWNPATNHLFDIVDGEQGDDPACRPNQLFAISLPHAVLDESRWQAVMNAAEERLLTPVGLRSLAPGHPDYKSKYFGDLRARDAAYHQGTVWGWLIGPYIDAWRRVHPAKDSDARALLHAYENHLNEACIGSISEVFDAEAPYTPRACIAQAWSVAEVARCWAATATGTIQ